MLVKENVQTVKTPEGVRTNDGAKNFRLMKTPAASTAKESWIEVVPHRDDVLLEGFEIFRDYLVTVERTGGLIRMRIRQWSGTGEHSIDFGEPALDYYIETRPRLLVLK